MIGKSALGSPLREICTMGSERGDEYKRLRPVGEGTGSKESEYSEAPQRATTSRLVPTHQQESSQSQRLVSTTSASRGKNKWHANQAYPYLKARFGQRVSTSTFSVIYFSVTVVKQRSLRV